MNRDEMLHLFEAHREAEAARDFDAILVVEGLHERLFVRVADRP